MAQKQLNVIQRLVQAIRPQKNTLGGSLVNVPLFNRTGARPLTNELNNFYLTDDQRYVGYLYGAIRKRANRVAQLATETLKTRLRDDLEAPMHPYLDLIDSSPSFSNYFFWNALSTFIDLKGTAYIFALRNFTEATEESQGVIGKVQSFKIINPYSISRVVNKDGKIGGYVETKNGYYREIPVQQMIVVNNLNPFNLDGGYAMTDAAKDSQFLHQSSSAFTRQALHKNVGQRGLITTEVILDDEQFSNFKARVQASGGIEGAGDFLFGNGPGSINYEDMQIDLDKLALEKISEVSREELFAVAGVSKTIMGVEVSGVTRETGKMQSDLFDRNETMPQLQSIIDALNQDYKNSYVDEYSKVPQAIYIDSPLKTDREAELADANVLKTKAEAAQILIATGFAPEAVLETVGLDEMDYEKPVPATPTKEHIHVKTEHHHHDHTEEVTENATGPNDSLSGVIRSQETSLQNEVVNIQKQILGAVVKHIAKNAISSDQEEEIITKTDKNKILKQLEKVLSAFGLSTIGLFANRTLRKRLEQFGLTAIFKVDGTVKQFIKTHAEKAASSHMDTILSEIYQKAREAAGEGLGRDQIVGQLTELFNDSLSTSRATRIARTESNRLNTEAQFQADRQFVEQNDLKEQAYKQWVVRSSNPCEFCLEMASMAPIPFDQPFLALGESITADRGGESVTYVAGYEEIESGTLHPNCSCIYEIIIVRE